MTGITKASGMALAAGGVLLVITNAVLTPMMPADAGEAALRSSDIYLFRMIGALLTAVLLVFGTLGLHLVQRGRAGVLGAIAFVTLMAGHAMLTGLEWANLFVMRPLALTTPDALEPLDEAATLAVGFGVTIALFTLGWLLMLISHLRTAVLPRAASLATLAGLFLIPLLAASPLGPITGQIVGNVVFGGGIAALGWSVMRLRDPAPT